MASLQVHNSSIPATELEPEELAQLYVTYTMLILLHGIAVGYEAGGDIRERCKLWKRMYMHAKFPISKPTTLKEIQSELDENATLCDLEPESIDDRWRVYCAASRYTDVLLDCVIARWPNKEDSRYMAIRGNQLLREVSNGLFNVPVLAGSDAIRLEIREKPNRTPQKIKDCKSISNASLGVSIPNESLEVSRRVLSQQRGKPLERLVCDARLLQVEVSNNKTLRRAFRIKDLMRKYITAPLRRCLYF